MAQTFTAYFSGIAFAQNKNMGAILNTSASEVLKVYRIGLVNAQTVGVTGVITEINVRLIQTSATLTSSTTITPTSHDSTNTAPASATYGSAGTIGGTPATIRRTIWSNDEPATGVLTNDEMECFIPFNIIWDAGYGDSNVQPITLRQNQMLYVFNVTNTAVGTLDVWMEFTKE